MKSSSTGGRTSGYSYPLETLWARLKKNLKKLRNKWHQDIYEEVSNQGKEVSASVYQEVGSKLDEILQLSQYMREDDIDSGLRYLQESREAKRVDTILNAPAPLRHTFERIAEIIRCDLAAKSCMNRVYEGDRYFFRRVKDPGGELTAEQQKQIADFWNRYSFCYKNDSNVQRILSLSSGRFDPTYIPWGLFYHYCIKYWNHPIINFVRDKNYTRLAFPNVKQANAVVRRIAGRYYNMERDVISKEEACNICLEKLAQPQHQKLIVKPWEGGGGSGISFLRKGYTKEQVADVLGKYNQNFVCEEIVVAHNSYAEPHPDSLNTLRVITFSYQMDIHLVGILFRMGVDGEVDNLGSGGLMILLDREGRLNDYAYDLEGNKHYQHPNGYVFAGKKLFNVEKVIETAKKLHATIPQLRYISWDFAVDQEGTPVLIELNGGGEQIVFELSGGHTFINGEVAKKLLDDWILKRFFYDRATWNWNFREYNDHVEITKYAGLYTTVKVPEKMNGKPVTAVKDWAFTNEKMSEIRIPKTVKTIEAKALLKAGKECRIIRV